MLSGLEVCHMCAQAIIDYLVQPSGRQLPAGGKAQEFQNPMHPGGFNMLGAGHNSQRKGALPNLYAGSNKPGRLLATHAALWTAPEALSCVLCSHYLAENRILYCDVLIQDCHNVAWEGQ